MLEELSRFQAHVGLSSLMLRIYKLMLTPEVIEVPNKFSIQMLFLQHYSLPNFLIPHNFCKLFFCVSNIYLSGVNN